MPVRETLKPYRFSLLQDVTFHIRASPPKVSHVDPVYSPGSFRLSP